MNILYHSIIITSIYIIVAEIPEALDALVHQFPGQIHGALARHAEHGYLGVMLCTEFVQVTQRQNRHAAHFFPDQVGVDIKDAQQLVAVGVAADEAGHRRTQAASADQDGGQLFAVAKQQIADLGAQHIDLVADALLAEPAKAVEILPHLTGGGAHHVGQLAGGDFLLAVGRQGRQVAVILGKTLDNGKRYLALNSHARLPHICNTHL